MTPQQKRRAKQLATWATSLSVLVIAHLVWLAWIEYRGGVEGGYSMITDLGRLVWLRQPGAVMITVVALLLLWLPPVFYVAGHMLWSGRETYEALDRASRNGAAADEARPGLKRGVMAATILAVLLASCGGVKIIPPWGDPQPQCHSGPAGPTCDCWAREGGAAGPWVKRPPCPPTPSPSPSPGSSPLPIPSPQPIPSPSPSPGEPPGECRAPQDGQGGEWVGEGLPRDPAPIRNEDRGVLEACEALNAALVDLGNCGGVGGRCEHDPPERQAFFRERVVPELQRRGWCAGQHEDGHSDELSMTRADTYPRGPWYNFHPSAGRTMVWCKPDRDNCEGAPDCEGKGSWRGRWWFAEDGTPIPSPQPAPSPSPEPRPIPRPSPTTPPPARQVVAIAGRIPVRPGSTVTLECRVRGAAVSPETWFVGAQLGGPIKREHFKVSGGGARRVLSVRPDCPTEPIVVRGVTYVARFTANCVVDGVSSPNLRMPVVP